MVCTICSKQSEGIEMGVDKEYKLHITSHGKTISNSRLLTLFDVLKELLLNLQQLNALDCCETGEFITTQNPYNKEFVVKRYAVTITVPYTTLTVRKTSKGSINKEQFMSTLKYIKELYYERI